MITFLKNTKRYAIALLVLALAVSCSNDDDQTMPFTTLSITLNAPEDLENTELSDLKIVFKELNSGELTERTTITDGKLEIVLPEGTYEISVGGKIKYKLDNTSQSSDIKGLRESFALTGDTASEIINLFLSVFKDDFIIEEIFFTGTVTPEGKQYNGDKYIKIKNGTNKVLYADGLVISQSEFMTVDKQDYTPDIMSEKLAVSNVSVIPGNGTDYPIEPGKSFTVAVDGVNHKEANPNSFDLSKADFEFYNIDSDDVDNPNVPNIINVFAKMVVHNRGFRSFAISRLEVSHEVFLADHKYDYEYMFVFGEYEFPMSQESYAIPNNWVLDAVNLSVESEFKWIVTDPSLDTSWTYCGKIDGDKARYGKSVRRKVLSIDIDGNDILRDDNNSALDFHAEAVPSLKN